MFVKPPPEKPWLSWLLFVIWSMIIFATIPLSMTIQRAFTNFLGHAAITYCVILAVLIALIWAVLHLRRRDPFVRSSYLWLIGVAAVIIGYTLKLSAIPVESIHFVQYGILGVLAYRALAHRIQESSIYFAAAVLCGIVGICDEFIQWLIPERYWGLDDIWINFVGAALVQLGIAKGIRPAYILGRSHRNNLQFLCRLSIIALFLLGLSLSNSPPRIAWYAKKIPGLGFLKDHESVMVEYGYLYNDPEIGRFRSRLAPEKLKTVDAQRGKEAATILDRYQDKSMYDEFLDAYTPLTDPFLHEARVHLFRRNFYFVDAARHRNDNQTYAKYMTIAYRENQIMEKYFPVTMHHSAYVWSDQQVARARQKLLKTRHYESRVSHRLITLVNEHQVAIFFVLLLIGLGFCHHVLGRTLGTNRRPVTRRE